MHWPTEDVAVDPAAGVAPEAVALLVDDGAVRMLVVKGAPEDIFKFSTQYEASDTSTACAWQVSWYSSTTIQRHRRR